MIIPDSFVQTTLFFLVSFGMIADAKVRIMPNLKQHIQSPKSVWLKHTGGWKAVGIWMKADAGRRIIALQLPSHRRYKLTDAQMYITSWF